MNSLLRNIKYFKVPISCLGILRTHNIWILLRKNVTQLVVQKYHFHGLFCSQSWIPLFGMFLEARIPFVFVRVQETMRKTYNSLLQTLFLSKSMPTMTSLPVTLTVKKSMKMKFLNDKMY